MSDLIRKLRYGVQRPKAAWDIKGASDLMDQAADQLDDVKNDLVALSQATASTWVEEEIKKILVKMK